MITLANSGLARSTSWLEFKTIVKTNVITQAQTRRRLLHSSGCNHKKQRYRKTIVTNEENVSGRVSD